MTGASTARRSPAVLTVSKPADTLNLIVHGQGVVAFDASETCSLVFQSATPTICDAILVEFTTGAVKVSLRLSGEELVDPSNTQGLITTPGASYWVSLDSQNQRLLAGIGEARQETAIYRYAFPRDAGWETRKAFLESLSNVKPLACRITRLVRDPITRSVPLLVMGTEQLTMDDIAAARFMPVANLSPIAQKLHNCISGKAFTLNTPEFPDFVKAIEASIATPGLWCYERLKQKANEFSKDKPNPAETYLRITLGENNGESPGIPYVMEIWPVGHYSPVHNHGGANAVIRVLNGSIHVRLFPFLGAAAPFGEADFKKGDITWMSSALNTVHQLKNLETNKDTCITIQCYLYDEEDLAHYDYFDYLDETGTVVQQYEPDSDMDFVAFKALMKQEWGAAHQQAWPKRWRLF
jgi:hypothetical protein